MIDAALRKHTHGYTTTVPLVFKEFEQILSPTDMLTDGLIRVSILLSAYSHSRFIADLLDRILWSVQDDYQKQGVILPVSLTSAAFQRAIVCVFVK